MRANTLCGFMRFGLVRYGMVRSGTVRYGKVYIQKSRDFVSYIFEVR